MEDIVEISSDSNDTIILPFSEIISHDRYELRNVEEHKKNKTDILIPNLSTSIDIERNIYTHEDDSLLKKLYAKYLPSKVEIDKDNEKNLKNSDDQKCVEGEVLNGTNKINTNLKISNKKLEQNKRKLEKQDKKELLLNEKVKKQKLRVVKKYMNPDECLKTMIVKIDEKILSECGQQMIQDLNSHNITYKSFKHASDGIISWSRKVQTCDELVDQVLYVDEKHFLLILESSNFKSLVKTNDLVTYIYSISAQLQFQHLSIAVLGIDKPSEEQENSVMEVEILFKTYWQFVKKVDDLAALIYTLTKAIAQIPYKLQKQEKYILHSEYFADCNKDTVRVDKSGNGLSRLWSQMLTMLPQARLETAEAITSVYPTPLSLFKAYEANDIEKNEGLLQDLLVKRANQHLATASKRIGPELSKKCAFFFKSTDDVYI